MTHALESAWRLRNTLASALEQVLDDLGVALRDAQAPELVEFIDGFMPGRAVTPEWTASLERLVELLWQELPAATMAALHAEYAGRAAPIWQPVANKLAPEHGAALAARRYQPSDARRAAVVLR